MITKMTLSLVHIDNCIEEYTQYLHFILNWEWTGHFLLDTWIILLKSNCHLIVITWFQCVKKILWVPMGSQIRHLLPRWSSPNVLACLNLNLTQGHPLVAKFGNMFESPMKDMAQNYGSTVKYLTLSFSPKFSGGVSLHVWKPGKKFGPKSQCWIFHGRPLRGGGRTPTALFKIFQLLEKYCFENQNVKNKIWKKYISNNT